MIVERYLDWAETAPAHLRAEAAGALARSYVMGELDPEMLDEVADALTRSLDDTSIAVRCAIAEALAWSPDAPHAIVFSLAQDAADVAEPILSRSPALTDLELVDLVAQGGDRQQVAIARRPYVSVPLAAAIAEVGSARACETLVKNPGAELTRSAAARIAARHGDDGAVRDALLSHDGVPPELRQILMRSVADALAAFVSDCGWLGASRARRAADEACDRGAIMLAAEASDARAFVLHLTERKAFSPSLALRAVLCGNLALFESALVALSGQTATRVAGFVRDYSGRGFEALYLKAGFPASALPAFRAALSAHAETGFSGSMTGDAALSRRMVERALTACEGTDIDVQSLRALLRRFAAEAAREESRRGTDVLVARAAA